MGWFISQPEHVGDDLNVWALKDTVVGYITAPVSANAMSVAVSSTVIDNMDIGFYLNLTDGNNISYMGEVIAVDTGNSIVTTNQAADNSFSPLGPTYVRMRVPIITDMPIRAANQRYTFAEKKLGGKAIDPGWTFDIDYCNKTGGAKKFPFVLEMMF